MDYILFVKCIVSGFFLAAPIGPVNLICIRHTLSQGRVSGLMVGMGAAVADALYGYAAATGLNVLTAFILHYNSVFHWGGGLFIVYVGFITFRATPQNPTDEKNLGPNLYRIFAKVFLLTVANPVTVFTFIAAFSSFGIAILVTNFFKAALAALGVFIGSAIWWITLTSIVCLFRNRVTPSILVGVNKIAGIIIILLGIISIVEF